jgi:hypothetical protein
MRINSKYLISIAALLLVTSLTVVLISSCRKPKKHVIEDGIEYTFLSSHNAYEVTKSDKSTKADIVIPTEINDVPVRGIGVSAFVGNETVKSVKISGGVSYIADGAFSGCKALERITLPVTLTRIGEKAFEKCEKLKYVSLGGVMHIGDYAFSECQSLTEIDIPDDTAELGAYAFYNAISLEKIKIGLGLTEIKDSTFAGCRALISAKLHDEIRSVGESAFRDCLELSEVWLGYGLESIGADAFSGCERLKYAYFKNFDGWSADGSSNASFTAADLTDPALAADYLSVSFAADPWHRAK